MDTWFVHDVRLESRTKVRYAFEGRAAGDHQGTTPFSAPEGDHPMLPWNLELCSVLTPLAVNKLAVTSQCVADPGQLTYKHTFKFGQLVEHLFPSYRHARGGAESNPASHPATADAGSPSAPAAVDATVLSASSAAAPASRLVRSLAVLARAWSSHERAGNVSFNYDLRRCPSAVTPSELTAIGQCWRELGLKNYAQAREMESNVGLQSFSFLVERVQVSEQEAVRFAAGPAAAPNGQRYVVLWWEAEAHGAATPTPASPPPVSLSTPPQNLLGFLTAEFDLDTAVLFIGYEKISSWSQIVLAQTLSTLFRGITEDAGVAPHNFAQCPIKDVWWTERCRTPGLASELSNGFRDIGFVPLADYCTEFGIGIHIFARQKLFASSAAPFFEQYATPFLTVWDWTRSLAAREP
ncbi:hypothetical protein BDK51DRAFT_46526 [Blyttiomyces helicus]|uniref:Uncharacterized protein n=1 Tax=Blyttiomyces helicus TaxID=388810 RepID=A0A4P9VVJ4_9FUNG|nr:hypothetical protein BDK51DRAFT_46526 [Blyttiomyces helicus]|eukprot:RKO83142.1 hypothetical protein BDK51DRAFT_46526 [Blyttiomyces helicus]